VGFDEPEEHWAPPDSLDPTPVWKQYILVVLLGAGVFVFAIVYAYIALLPDVVSPPAVLPGRVILSALQYAPGTTQKVSLAGPNATFYLTYDKAEPIAVRATWSPAISSGSQCAIVLPGEPIPGAPGKSVETAGMAANAAVFLDACTLSVFDARGDRVAGSAPRGLDRYLVSRKGDRLIVNTDHIIQGTP